jgi:acyl-coenzyme A synthetase/AMP-(fatty) acid ligase/acyl carrier protein
MFHSYAFDFSVWELWGALLYGGRLVVVPFWVSRSPEAFHKLLWEERVTVLSQTPSAFRQLMLADEAAGQSAEELSLRLVVFGGEALDFRSLAPWVARHGDERPRLVNMYGITETTVHVTYRPVTRRDVEDAWGSPIGVPIPDLQTYVLDEGLRLLPAGVAGEVCVGGAGLARGYEGQPALTAERFVPHPFSTRPGERLYRSGDMARYDARGGLEYLGRRDRQVKLRGFRIELGEIEAALRSHEWIRDVVVTVGGESGDGKRLVAYVVGRGGPGPGAGGLRAYLRGRLPDYMAPSAYVELEELPLTPSGKVDFAALPEAGRGAGGAAGAAFVGPRTEVEGVLCRVWAETLGLEAVGVGEDFFELGGHSLLAARVVSRVREELGVELPLREVFERPTVEGAADKLEGRTGSGFEVTRRDEDFFARRTLRATDAAKE